MKQTSKKLYLNKRFVGKPHSEYLFKVDYTIIFTNEEMNIKKQIVDKDGKIFLVGRKKNTIVLENGKNICPEEVENIIETNIDYAEDIVVYQAKHTLGQASRDIICAGLFIKDESVRSDKGRIEADFLRINELLPDYKRIEYIELAESEYEKTSTRKIKRTILPQECSGKGIIL